MASMSTFLENAILDLVLNNEPYTGSGSVYVALYTSPTDDDSAGTEVTGGSYARTLCSGFNTPSGGTTQNAFSVVFPTATGTWGTITHLALVDAASGGNRLYHGPLTVPKTVNTGDTFQLPVGNIIVSNT